MERYVIWWPVGSPRAGGRPGGPRRINIQQGERAGGRAGGRGRARGTARHGDARSRRCGRCGAAAFVDPSLMNRAQFHDPAFGKQIAGRGKGRYGYGRT